MIRLLFQAAFLVKWDEYLMKDHTCRVCSKRGQFIASMLERIVEVKASPAVSTHRARAKQGCGRDWIQLQIAVNGMISLPQ
jgi:hypothetical protein